jgi:hypothetical protein
MRGAVIMSRHPKTFTEAAIEPDLRLALAKPRFRWLRFT